MARNLPVSDPGNPEFRICHDQIDLRTEKRTQFIDITDWVAECVRRSRITDGIASVQTLHTTTAIVINENEPLLQQDLETLLEVWAPSDVEYRHDDLGARVAPYMLEERVNGYAHARAVLLGSSRSLNIANGRLRLGRWQRIFLVELDGAQKRSTSITVMGLANGDRPRRPESQSVEPAELRGVS